MLSKALLCVTALVGTVFIVTTVDKLRGEREFTLEAIASNYYDGCMLLDGTVNAGGGAEEDGLRRGDRRQQGLLSRARDSRSLGDSEKHGNGIGENGVAQNVGEQSSERGGGHGGQQDMDESSRSSAMSSVSTYSARDLLLKIHQGREVPIAPPPLSGTAAVGV